MTRSDPRQPLLTLRVLSGHAPEQYRNWLRTGLWAALIGYTLAFATLLLDFGWTRAGSMSEPFVMAAALVAITLERRGRLQAAAMLILTALWLELHTSLVFVGITSSAMTVFPALLVGATLFLGPRSGVAWALSTMATIPGALAARAWLLDLPLLARGDLSFLVVALASAVSCALLLALFMQTFGRTLHTAEQNALRARALIDGAPDGILAINTRGEVEDCNPSAERMLGISAPEMTGVTLADLGIVDAHARDERTSVDTFTGDAREYFVVRTGMTLEGVLRMAGRNNGSGGSLIMLRDITQRKAAEQRANELQMQLQHSQKLEAVGQLAGGVAHDINNLLTAVGGYGDLLRHHPEPLVREVAEELSAARERGTGLTRQLLAFARKELAQPRGLDLVKTIRDMKRLLQRLIGEQAELVFELLGPARLYADPGQLEQVILNLTLNARDALPGRGTITIRCFERGLRVLLEVSDTGCGMSEATRLRIFEPFFTTKPRGSGTGLGLSTVHGIVESSGGDIVVRSELGQGTTFTLSWPVHENQELVVEAAVPAPLPETRRGRVLVVEDDDQNRVFLARLLAAAGYDTVIAANAAQAQQRWVEMRRHGKAPGLLLTDVRMPGITGIELATRLRADAPGIPVVFMSGYLGETLDSRDFDPQQDLLPKPFTAEQLLDRIDAKLGRSSSSSMSLRAQGAEGREPTQDSVSRS